MVDDLRAAVAETPVLGFSMIGVPFPDAEAAFAALDGVVEVHLDRSIDYPGMASLTAAPRTSPSGTACSPTAPCTGIDRTQVLAVADGPNDIELLTNAAIRAVPEVAHPSALDLATTVIPSARTAAGPRSSRCSADPAPFSGGWWSPRRSAGPRTAGRLGQRLHVFSSPPPSLDRPQA